MRILFAGESHGIAMTSIIEGFPKGVKISQEAINKELRRRMQGFGRGGRMKIEKDETQITSGLRNKVTLGSPITLVSANNDARIFAQKDDKQEKLTVPRPGHSDLAGYFKYGEKDVRNILERSSARETLGRVAVGSICKQFLSNFNINIASFVVGVGSVISDKRPKNIAEINKLKKSSKLETIDPKTEKLMIKEIEKANRNKDTLGAIVEVWAENVVAGLGSFMQYDRRLDAQISLALMSIPSVKAVEIGAGFDYAMAKGSLAHDEIYFSKAKGFYRSSNNSGGIEGGMSNGCPIVACVGAKPIPTLRRPLSSVDLTNKKPKKAVVERSDTCVAESLAVITESMLAVVITQNFLEKFGCDSLAEIKRNYNAYIKTFR